MDVTWVESHCLAMPGAVKDWKEEWECHRYLVGGKMFLMDGENKEGTPILTLKLEPLRGDLVRKEYGDITPGYYMNKDWWNSIHKDGDVPEDLLRDMLDESYRLVFASLTKKAQKEILDAVG